MIKTEFVHMRLYRHGSRMEIVRRKMVEMKSLNVFIYLFVYLFIFTEGKDGRREKNINVWLPLACPLFREPGMCPTLEMEIATLWFKSWHSIY